MMVAKSYVREGFTMRRLITAFALASALTLMTSMGTLAATFVPISSPDAAYLAATNYIDPSTIPDGTTVESISDGTLTVSFDYQGIKYTAPSTDWSSWSKSPDSQRPDGGSLPIIHFRNVQTVTFTLDQPVNIFGFEAQPAFMGNYTLVAKFYDQEGGLLGTIEQPVSGDGGARLFAARYGDANAIKSVVFSPPDLDQLVFWAAGAFRYGFARPQQDPEPVIPEPGTLVLMGIGGLAIGLGRRFGRK
jgi:hypothetical protein